MVSSSYRALIRASMKSRDLPEQTAAVFEVLDAAVSPELMEKVTAALPVDIGGLLPTARTGDGPEE
ncbi:hypothetical protein [Streptomyces sp. DT171]|uniref:hypothetical protein n=1 Tax=Streptomyces sp. DT171 TaxID=3416524 RepID=UPI003CE72D44